ncbi:unnamed protein product [Gadus morhua 'NCC']
MSPWRAAPGSSGGGGTHIFSRRSSPTELSLQNELQINTQRVTGSPSINGSPLNRPTEYPTAGVLSWKEASAFERSWTEPLQNIKGGTVPWSVLIGISRRFVVNDIATPPPPPPSIPARKEE